MTRTSACWDELGEVVMRSIKKGSRNSHQQMVRRCQTMAFDRQVQMQALTTPKLVSWTSTSHVGIDLTP
jgi:hypothetical protein